MALNLIRNSRVFFTTNVNASSGVVNQADTLAFSNTNTFEIQVLEGFSFSQNTNSETVTLNEAGATPTRGQRSFNTSLAPVDFSFSTYIRPKKSTTVKAEESYLWNALLCDTNIGTSTSLTSVSGVAMSNTGLVTISGTSIAGTLPTINSIVSLSGIATTVGSANQDKYINGTGKVVTSSTTSITIQMYNHAATAVTSVTFVTAGTVKYSTWAWNESNLTYSQATTGLSEKNQLQKFGMLFLVDNTLYAIDNCCLTQVTIDFGIDQIATAQWTGQATAIRKLSNAVTIASGATTFTGGTGTDVGSGGFTAKVTDANFITNRLTTVTLTAQKAMGSDISASDAYPLAITGGSITINNNVTYITPAVLGVVNSPITYFAGARAITGNLTAYLRTGGTKDIGELLSDLLIAASTTTEPMFKLDVAIGGSSASTKVELELPSVRIGIPTINTEQVISAGIEFTAAGASGSTYDITIPNELMIRYFSV